MSARGEENPPARDHGPHTLRVWRGVVVGLFGDDVFVELGPRMQGVISLREFETKPAVGETYDFTLHGRQDGAGNLVVDSGEWVKGDLVDSRRDHPDFVYHVADPASIQRNSQNPEIDPAIVDKILGR